jgi:hypothetical protein
LKNVKHIPLEQALLKIAKSLFYQILVAVDIKRLYQALENLRMRLLDLTARNRLIPHATLSVPGATLGLTSNAKCVQIRSHTADVLECSSLWNGTGVAQYVAGIQMDAETLAYYDTQAAAVGERYRSAAGGISLWFEDAFTGFARILDVGCGAGLDLCRLFLQGHDVFGADNPP